MKFTTVKAIPSKNRSSNPLSIINRRFARRPDSILHTTLPKAKALGLSALLRYHGGYKIAQRQLTGRWAGYLALYISRTKQQPEAA